MWRLWMMPRTLTFLFAFVSLHVSSAVAGFSFSWSTPTQCDQFTVSWQGGASPYSLLLVPSYATPYNYSIPDSSYDANAGKGSFSLTLNVSTSKQFVLVMSDSTGFGSGGVSSLVTVGNSIGGSCNSSDTSPPFTFGTPDDLQQCQPYEFVYGGVQPITIYGLIPSGDAFVLHPPGGSSYSWTADIAARTSVIFIMTDSQGHSGGATVFLSVDPTADTSCLNANSPTSTSRSNPPTQTQTQTTQTTQTTQAIQTTQTQSTTGPTSSPSHSGGQSDLVPVIAGSAGGVLFVVAVAFVFFGLRRRKQRREKPQTVMFQPAVGTYTESHVPYAGGPGPYTGGPGPYTGGQDPYTGSHGPYAGGPGPYTGGQDPYTGSHGPYAGGHDPYTGNHDIYAGSHDLYTGSHGPDTGSHGPDSGSQGLEPRIPTNYTEQRPYSDIAPSISSQPSQGNSTKHSSTGASNHGSDPSSRAILHTDAGTTVNTRQTRDIMEEVQEEIVEPPSHNAW